MWVGFGRRTKKNRIVEKFQLQARTHTHTHTVAPRAKGCRLHPFRRNDALELLLSFFFFIIIIHEIPERPMKYRRSFSAPALGVRPGRVYYYYYYKRATCVIAINKQFVKAKTILMK